MQTAPCPIDLLRSLKLPKSVRVTFTFRPAEPVVIEVLSVGNSAGSCFIPDWSGLWPRSFRLDEIAHAEVVS